MSAEKDTKVCKESEVTSGLQVATNALVVGRLLRFLEWEDLLNCRFVSQFWNDQVVHTVLHSPKSYRNEKNVDIFRTFEFELEDRRYRGEVEEKLEEICLLLEESKHPEFLIDKAKIYYHSESKVCPSAVLQCQQILQKFGSLIKKLEIKVDGQTHLLSRCLGQEGYCPNLQKLYLDLRDNCDSPFTELDVGSLKLEKLEIDNYCKNSKSEWKGHLLEIFKKILENSPLITKLSIRNFQSHPFWHYSNIKVEKPNGLSTETKLDSNSPYFKTRDFIQVLQRNPKITSNLKKLLLDGCLLENADILSTLQFGSNLKKLVLFEMNENIYNTLLKGTEGYTKFLKNVSPYLERLKLRFSRNWDLIDLIDIPLMPKLKEVNYYGPHYPYFFEFLKRSPSLQTFTLNLCESVRYDVLWKECWKEEEKSLLYSSNYTPRLLHQGLKYIHLCNKDIYRPETIRELNVAFPNLSGLEIKPKIKSGCFEKEQGSWFGEFFHHISQMKHLKYLLMYLSFENSEIQRKYMGAIVTQACSIFNVTETDLNRSIITKTISVGYEEEEIKAWNFEREDSLPIIYRTENRGLTIFHRFLVKGREDVPLKTRILQLKPFFKQWTMNVLIV